MKPKPLSVVSVDPRAGDAQNLRRLLRQIDVWEIEFKYCGRAPEAVEVMADQEVDVVFTEQNLRQSSGLTLLKRLRDAEYHHPMILLTDEGSESLAGSWIRAGGDDYLPKRDLSVEVVFHSMDRAVNRSAVIEELREENERLQEQTFTDPLTGLFNRRYMEKRLREEVNRTRRYDTRIGIMMLDLDNFKQVNDELGHTTGDEVLKMTARTLREETRESDTVVRYGGDEFCILLPEVEKRETKTIARRIQAKLGLKSSKLDLGSFGTLRCSIGITEDRSGISDPQNLIEEADRGLYQSKQRGESTYTPPRRSSGVGLTTDSKDP